MPLCNAVSKEESHGDGEKALAAFDFGSGGAEDLSDCAVGLCGNRDFGFHALHHGEWFACLDAGAGSGDIQLLGGSGSTPTTTKEVTIQQKISDIAGRL